MKRLVELLLVKIRKGMPSSTSMLYANVFKNQITKLLPSLIVIFYHIILNIRSTFEILLAVRYLPLLRNVWRPLFWRTLTFHNAVGLVPIGRTAMEKNLDQGMKLLLPTELLTHHLLLQEPMQEILSTRQLQLILQKVKGHAAKENGVPRGALPHPMNPNFPRESI